MAKIGVRLKIDVSKIDKDALFKGKKSVYLDATTFIDLDELDHYGNSGMITQDLSKERSQAGEKGAILGNSKVFWKDEGQQQRQQAPQQQAQPQSFGSWGQQQQNQAQQQSQNNGFQQQGNQGVDDSIPF